MVWCWTWLYEARDIEQCRCSQDKIDAWFDAKTKGLNGSQRAALREQSGTPLRQVCCGATGCTKFHYVGHQCRVREQDVLEDTSLSFAIWGWLERTIEGCMGSLKVNLSLLLRQLKNLDEIQAAYGVEVEALAVAQRYEKPVEANQRGYRSAVLGKDVTAGRARRASDYVAIAGWNVRSFVDLNASDDLEGKTEVGKSTHPSLAERAEHQHAVPVDR